ALGEAGAAGKPIKIAGADEARWAPDAVSGGPAYAMIGVRRGALVFVLGIPTGKNAQAPLTKLAELVLTRLGGRQMAARLACTAALALLGGCAGVPAGQSSDGGLDPTLPPGSNFDLSLWDLQEPIGSDGSPTVISPTELAAGFHDSYFFTDPVDGAMTFWD